MMAGVWKPVRIGAVAAVALLTACTDSQPATTASEVSTSRTVLDVVTTLAPQSQAARHEMGQAFTLGEVRIMMLSVQDPFAPTAQVQPAPGNRLVSIRYEVVSQSSDSQRLSDLPTVELRDAAGAGYEPEHGRLSVVGGARAPGELPAGKRMESSAVFEIPASATGLGVAFRWPGRPADPGVVVALD